MRNLDSKTVASFGDEWSRFDQSVTSDKEMRKVFDDYFRIFPWNTLPEGAIGFDLGCGSGRWARLVADRVGHLNCVDPSGAVDVARKNLSHCKNVTFYQATVEECGLKANSQDFGYSLGVLHHVPDTEAALRSCVNLLKPGAPLLLYIYYALDNRPFWFRGLWRISDLLRGFICTRSPWLKNLITDFLALFVYYPLARFANLLDYFGVNVHSIPLSYYRRRSLYLMRTDARDRFGTPLEKRFTRVEVHEMCVSAGLVDVVFSDRAPYWCVVGFKSCNP